MHDPVETTTQTVDLSVDDLEFVAPGPSATELRKSVTRLKLLRLAQQGLNATTAAKALGISPSQARVHYADPSFQKEALGRVSKAFAGMDDNFLSATKTFAERLEEQAERSFDALVTMLEEKRLSPALEARVHQDFMDRSQESMKNMRAVSKTEIDPTLLARAARTASEMDAARSGKVVEMRKTG